MGRILNTLGARRLIDCDRLVHEAFRPGHPVGKKVKALFHVPGTLKRRKIRAEVFSSAGKRRRLEAILHPYVFRRVTSELGKIKAGIVVLEVPLLFETGFERFCDVTIAVRSGERNIMRRLRPLGVSAYEVQSRLGAQLTEREKERRADLSIHNSGSKVLLIRKTRSIWKKLVRRYNQKKKSERS